MLSRLRYPGAVLAVMVLMNAGLTYPTWSRWIREFRLSQKPGFSCHTYIDSSGQEHRYSLFVPHHRRSGEPLPLILYLNGVGENGDDGVLQISNNFGLPVWEMQQNFPFVCLAPQCRINGSWDPDSQDTRTALAILDEVIHRQNVDPDRVIVTGPSAGGSGAWEFVRAFPQRFAGVVPVSAFAPTGSLEEFATSLAHSRLPVWSFFNDGDASNVVEANRQVRAALIAQGLSPHFTELNKSGHNSWDEAYRSPELFEWMWNVNRRDNQQQALFSSLSHDVSSSDWSTQGSGIQSEEAGAIRLSPDKSASCSLTTTQPRMNFELHFDLWLPGDSPAEIVWWGIDRSPGDSTSAHRLILAPPLAGSGGMIDDITGNWLVSADPVAQQSLRGGGWNDVRLRLTRNRWDIHVNGRPYLAIDNPAATVPLQVEFPVSTGQSGYRLRDLRVRSLEQELHR